MTIKTSTGLRNGMLGTGSLKSLLDGKVLKIYAGTAPATADSALGGATLLCTVSDDATGVGLGFDATPINGVLFKDPAQIWRGVNVASGTASFYRLQDISDDDSASTVNERVQGGVGVAGADLNISSVSLTAAASQNIDFYSIELPTA